MYKREASNKKSFFLLDPLRKELKVWRDLVDMDSELVERITP